MRCEINIIIHATEDENKVLNAVLDTLKINNKKININRRSVSGHFGNPIMFISISTKEDIFSIVENIISNLDLPDKIKLINELEEYFEGSKLYLRLDKQAICTGKMRLSESESIRLLFRGVKKDKVKKLLEYSVK